MGMIRVHVNINFRYIVNYCKPLFTVSSQKHPFRGLDTLVASIIMIYAFSSSRPGNSSGRVGKIDEIEIASNGG